MRTFNVRVAITQEPYTECKFCDESIDGMIVLAEVVRGGCLCNRYRAFEYLNLHAHTF